MSFKEVDLLMYYIPLLIIIIGILGSLCNIIIFRSPKFRLNSCIFYLLLSTIFDLIYIFSSGLTRFLKSDLINVFVDQSIFFCKFRTYIVVLTPTLSTSYLMFASIDRLLSTSSSKKCRNLSNIHLARRISIYVLIFFFISSSHILFFHHLERKSLNVNVSSCVPSNEIYRIYFILSLLLSNPLIAYMVMLISTIITLLRIRRSRCRINQRRRNLNRHLITIIVVQIGLGMLFTFFRCGFLIYHLSIETPRNLHLHRFLDQFSLFIYYLNFAKSFPVNIITSRLFRRAFYRQMNIFIETICHFNQKSIPRLNQNYQMSNGQTS